MLSYFKSYFKITDCFISILPYRIDSEKMKWDAKWVTTAHIKLKNFIRSLDKRQPKRATGALGLVSIKCLIECTVQRDEMKNDKQDYICFYYYAFFLLFKNIVYVYSKTIIVWRQPWDIYENTWKLDKSAVLRHIGSQFLYGLFLLGL